MLYCNKGSWKLRCKSDYTRNYITFIHGVEYQVKDKFPGEDGTIENGDWEIKDGRGGLITMTKAERDLIFEEI